MSRISRFIKLFRQAISGAETEYTTGSIDRAIFLLSVPMVLEMLMEGLFALVDIFFVAKLGKEATATIGLTEVVMSQIVAIALGLSMATTAMVARRIGEKDNEGAAVAAMQSILIGILICLIIAVVFYFKAGDILEFMGGSPDLIRIGTGYTRILLTGSSTMFFLYLLNAIFRGAGNAAIAMRTLWIANGINIILDPFLIFGIGPFPEMGVAGAAVATTIGRGVGVGYQVYHLVNGKSLVHLKLRHLQFVWDIIWKLLKVSSTGVLQFFIATASWLFIIRIIALFGDAAVAGYSIGIRIVIFTILPAWGMASAASTLVGQNLGAGQPDRAEKSVWRTAYFNMIFLTTISVLFVITAPWLIPFFTKEPEVIHQGVLCLRIICLGYIFYAYGMVIGQAFNGAGDTVTPTLINFVAFWMLQIPLSYTFAKLFAWGPVGVYWGIAISESLLALIAIAVFRRGKWKTVKI
ncbi:MAG: MATE family efflux transporter [Saprospiraceae bacterium]|nr:MATE family efflux transporter [Candidatus Opimibacter iunctus]